MPSAAPISPPQQVNAVIASVDAAFEITAAQGPLSSPEQLLAAVRKEILPALSEVLDHPRWSEVTLYAPQIDIDLGDWPDDPVWSEVRWILAHKLEAALSRFLNADPEQASPSEKKLASPVSSASPVVSAPSDNRSTPVGWDDARHNVLIARARGFFDWANRFGATPSQETIRLRLEEYPEEAGALAALRIAGLSPLATDPALQSELISVLDTADRERKSVIPSDTRADVPDPTFGSERVPGNSDEGTLFADEIDRLAKTSAGVSVLLRRLADKALSTSLPGQRLKGRTVSDSIDWQNILSADKLTDLKFAEKRIIEGLVHRGTSREDAQKTASRLIARLITLLPVVSTAPPATGNAATPSERNGGSLSDAHGRQASGKLSQAADGSPWDVPGDESRRRSANNDTDTKRVSNPLQENPEIRNAGKSGRVAPDPLTALSSRNRQFSDPASDHTAMLRGNDLDSETLRAFQASEPDAFTASLALLDTPELLVLAHGLLSPAARLLRDRLSDLSEEADHPAEALRKATLLLLADRTLDFEKLARAEPETGFTTENARFNDLASLAVEDADDPDAGETPDALAIDPLTEVLRIAGLTRSEILRVLGAANAQTQVSGRSLTLPVGGESGREADAARGNNHENSGDIPSTREGSSDVWDNHTHRSVHDHEDREISGARQNAGEDTTIQRAAPAEQPGQKSKKHTNPYVSDEASDPPDQDLTRAGEQDTTSGRSDDLRIATAEAHFSDRKNPDAKTPVRAHGAVSETAVSRSGTGALASENSTEDHITQPVATRDGHVPDTPGYRAATRKVPVTADEPESTERTDEELISQLEQIARVTLPASDSTVVAALRLVEQLWPGRAHDDPQSRFAVMCALLHNATSAPPPGLPLSRRLDDLLAQLEPDENRRTLALRTVSARLGTAPGPDATGLHRQTRAALETLLTSTPDTAAPSGQESARPVAIPAQATNETDGETLLVSETAGLVLLHPFYALLFDRTGIERQGRALETGDLPLARGLLLALAGTPDTTVPAPDPLHNILLGVDPAAPLPLPTKPDADADALMDGLLRSVIERWSRLGATSPDGLREAFLRRAGTLRLDATGAHLRVTPGPFDMLLDSLPWSPGPVTLPWMPLPCHVTWREDSDE
ncbi:contractile injection system tape measure protein [uncultured Roseobacter sp.]|uniref:contractile injection system tape measure protein n=1 Tax=uncultured Roseobacter sp. TaxID=114847 RepID=UPI0026287997|nr:contractile injection system tape measure protein [uncultured Roseobacter sp.]